MKTIQIIDKFDYPSPQLISKIPNALHSVLRHTLLAIFPQCQICGFKEDLKCHEIVKERKLIGFTVLCGSCHSRGHGNAISNPNGAGYTYNMISIKQLSLSIQGLRFYTVDYADWFKRYLVRYSLV